MPSGIKEPLILEKDGVEIPFPSIRDAWLTALRGPHDRSDRIGQPTRERVRHAITTHTQINGYYIYYARR
jgi:hypothetical protein